jgi:hypothetical protein
MRCLWPLACLGLALLGGCANTIDRLVHVGEAPS